MLTGPLFMLQVYDRVLASRSVSTLVALTLLVAARGAEVAATRITDLEEMLAFAKEHLEKTEKTVTSGENRHKRHNGF